MPSRPFVFASGRSASITVAKLIGAPLLSSEISWMVPLADFVFAASAARAAVMEVAVPSVSIFGTLDSVPPRGVTAGAAGVAGSAGAPRLVASGAGGAGCTSSAAGALGIIARYAGNPYRYVIQPTPRMRINMKNHTRNLLDFVSRMSGIGAGAGASATFT